MLLVILISLNSCWLSGDVFRSTWREWRRISDLLCIAQTSRFSIWRKCRRRQNG